MKPISKIFKDLFASKKVLDDNEKLKVMVKANAILEELVNEKKIPGLAITVLSKGETFFQKGYGFSDLETKNPVDPRHSIFRIASVSKPIAATALAIAVQEGLINLDASFYTYVRYYPKKKWDFTIRQLASHTAGIRGYKGVEYGMDKPFSIKESISIFKDDDLLFEPGTDYNYSSFDWVLISLTIQETSKMPFEKYVDEKVLKPLQLTHTFPEVKEAKKDTDKGVNTFMEADDAIMEKNKSAAIVTFYSRNRLGFRKAIPVNNFYKLAGGGYLSTSADIAKFGQAYLEGELLSDDFRKEFLRSEKINNSPTYYGLGWEVSEDKNGNSYYGHLGNGVGGYANFRVYPKEELVVVILTNCTNPGIQEELDLAIQALLSAQNSTQS